MRARLLEEPELQFGRGRHIDPRFGLLELGPADIEAEAAPHSLPLGIVGTQETIEGVARWLRRCRRVIEPPANARQPNFHPPFPGFRAEEGFEARLELDQRLQRPISGRAVRDVSRHETPRARIEAAVELLVGEIAALGERGLPRVVVVAPPLELLAATKPSEVSSTNGHPRGRSRPVELHDLLKARAMRTPIPLQYVLPATYDESKLRKQVAATGRQRQQQDEATRAWNLHTALYYKAGGFPWALHRDRRELDSCFIGLAFFFDANDTLATSMAQVFDERGDGVIVRGGPAKLTSRDRHPYLERDDAERLLRDALARYRDEHRNLPARVSVHKTSRFRPQEIDGLQAAADAERVEMLELVTIGPTSTRVSRPGQTPPLRGTHVALDDRQHLLYTSGSVPFYGTYPGPYVPQAIGFSLDVAEQSPEQHAREILALTKLNWNNSRLDGRHPITTRAARGIGTILRHLEPDEPIGARYAFYM